MNCKKCQRPFKSEKDFMRHEQRCELTEEKINKFRQLYLEAKINLQQIGRQANTDRLTVAYFMKDISRSKSEAIKLAHKNKPESFKMSDETKDKLRILRLQYLKLFPDQVPYRLYHSSKDNWIEKKFEQELEKMQIKGWVRKYRCGIYEYDFAFPVEKIDVEIDGSTHELEKVIKIDIRRDEWTKSRGWKVIRFKAEHVKHNLQDCINILLEFLRHNSSYDQNYIDKKFDQLQLHRNMEKDKQKIEIENIKKNKEQQKILKQQQEKEQLEKIIKTIDFTKRGCINLIRLSLNVSHTQVIRMIKKYFPDFRR